MSQELDGPVESAAAAGTPSCPIGTPCELRVVNRKQMLAECNPTNRSHRCPQAMWFGGAFFCRAIWLWPKLKD